MLGDEAELTAAEEDEVLAEACGLRLRGGGWPRLQSTMSIGGDEGCETAVTMVVRDGSEMLTDDSDPEMKEGETGVEVWVTERMSEARVRDEDDGCAVGGVSMTTDMSEWAAAEVGVERVDGETVDGGVGCVSMMAISLAAVHAATPRRPRLTGEEEDGMEMQLQQQTAGMPTATAGCGWQDQVSACDVTMWQDAMLSRETMAAAQVRS
jgi:hypothetical protein